MLNKDGCLAHCTNNLSCKDLESDNLARFTYLLRRHFLDFLNYRKDSQREKGTEQKLNWRREAFTFFALRIWLLPQAHPSIVTKININFKTRNNENQVNKFEVPSMLYQVPAFIDNMCFKF